jgi:hypothetical protein
MRPSCTPRLTRRSSAALLFALVPAALLATGCSKSSEDCGPTAQAAGGAAATTTSGAGGGATTTTTGGHGGAASGCPKGLLACADACVDPKHDPSNCGGCGKACGKDQVCSSGACGLVCLGGATACAGACVDLVNDPKNCGACGTACKGGEVCSKGACGATCEGGTTNCGGVCTQLAVDPKNCGVCGTACPDGEVCSNGTCGIVCAGGTLKCGGACVDPELDPKNCGGCANQCPQGQLCWAGKCKLECAGGTIACGDVCADTSTDPKNCGACGTVCPAGEPCVSGVCGVECPPGLATCAGACSDTNVDPKNCGACGTACPGGANAVGVCAQAKCALVCQGSYRDCNGSALDGCEADVSSDPANCGLCGKVCGAVAHGTTKCGGSSCVLDKCDAGYADCNGSPTDGCEASITNDKNNCGGCGNVCAAGKICQASQCVVPLWSPIATQAGAALGTASAAAGLVAGQNKVVYFQSPSAGTAYTFDTATSQFTQQPPNPDICDCSNSGGLVAANGKLYFFAANARSFTYGQPGSWLTLTYPVPRADAVYGVVGNGIFVTGGHDQGNWHQLTTQRYDTVGASWQTGLASTVAPYSQGNGGGDGTYFYAWGGLFQKAMSVYDPGKNTWTQLAGEPPYPTFGQAAPLWRGKLLVMAQNNVGLAPFDTASRTWGALVPMPPGVAANTSIRIAVIPGNPDDLYLLVDTGTGVTVNKYLN